MSNNNPDARRTLPPESETVTFKITVPKIHEGSLFELVGETMRGDYSRLEKRTEGKIDQAAAGATALHVICNAIRRNPTTGQCRRLTAFLAGLYNGPRFPFDLTELRGLDKTLADACFAVLNEDRRGANEIHKWGVVDADELNQWFQEQACITPRSGVASAGKLMTASSARPDTRTKG